MPAPMATGEEVMTREFSTAAPAVFLSIPTATRREST